MIEESQIKQILGEIELAENILRKRDTYKSFQICEGNLRYFVKERLKEMFPKTYDMFQVSDYSIIKKIVNKKAKAYKETPKRTLGSDEETALYQDLVSKFNLNEAMKEIDKLYNQYKYCLLAVFFERSLNDFGVMEENFKFIPLAPYEFDVVFNEMGELQCVVLSYPDQEVVTGPSTDQLNTLIAGDVQDVGADRKVYAVWTKTNHWLYQGNKNKNGKWDFFLAPNEKNPNNINPYGVLPFVYLPMDFSEDYPVASPLGYQTIELNAEMSTYYTSGSMQIGTLVLSYPSSQPIESVANGLFTGMKLPQSENPDAPETTASYIAPSPNMSGHREAIITHMSAILDEQGINSNQIVRPDESFTSGFDRLLSSADVQDIIEDNQGFYNKVENKVYQIVKAIFKNFIKKDLFQSEGLNVVYRKPKVLVSDTEKLNNLKQMKELELLLPWEIFMVYDPNLSEAQAIEKWEKMQQMKRTQINLLSPVESNQIEVQDEDMDEENDDDEVEEIEDEETENEE